MVDVNHPKKIYDTLFKRGTGGEVRTWRMELLEENGTGFHRVISGTQGGKKARSGWKQCSPKNVGKKNATTSMTQAKSEIEKLYVKKCDTGYFRDIDDIDGVLFTKPMLAVDWMKRKSKIDLEDGVIAQPKLDGIRCIARADGLWTRTGKPISISCKHVFDALKPLFVLHPDLVLDGELYNHDLREDFNTITSIVRKAKPSKDDTKKAERLIQYHVYDIVSMDSTLNRQIDLGVHLREVDNAIICVVPTFAVVGMEELDRLYGQWIEDGYEGQMIRLTAEYEHKRSNNLLKRKEFITEEFKVLRVEEGQGNWSGCVKRFVFELEDGRECGAGVRGSQEKLRELLESGKTPDWCTVRFFNPTPDGMPRFPVVVDYGFGKRND